MKRVTRPDEPLALSNSKAALTKALLDEIDRLAALGETLKTNSPLFKKYDIPEVRDVLTEMYNKLCCYCEKSVGNKGHIEHLMPKSKYPNQTYEWNNLHLACSDCNIKKGNKYNEEFPILNPVLDVIGNELKLKIRPKGIKHEAITARGRTTKDHTDLDREDLVKSRTEIFNIALDMMLDINSNPHNPNVPDIIDELEELEGGPFGSVVTLVRNGFGR